MAFSKQTAIALSFAALVTMTNKAVAKENVTTIIPTQTNAAGQTTRGVYFFSNPNAQDIAIEITCSPKGVRQLTVNNFKTGNIVHIFTPDRPDYSALCSDGNVTNNSDTARKAAQFILRK